MATAQVGLTSVDDHEAVIAARRELAPLTARVTELQARWRRVQQLTTPQNIYTDGPTIAATNEEVAAAHIDKTPVEGELRLAMLNESKAARRLAEARQAARAELLERLRVQQRDLARKKVRLLAPVLALEAEAVAVDDLVQSLSNGFGARVSWHELQQPTANIDSRYAAWRRSLREAGILTS